MLSCKNIKLLSLNYMSLNTYVIFTYNWSSSTIIDSCVSGFETPFKIKHAMDYFFNKLLFHKKKIIFFYCVICCTSKIWNWDLAKRHWFPLFSNMMTQFQKQCFSNKLRHLLGVLLIMLVGGLFVYVNEKRCEIKSLICLNKWSVKCELDN